MALGDARMTANESHTGLSGYGVLDPSTLAGGINVVLRVAAEQLTAGVAAELFVANATITVPSALVSVVLTVIAVKATYAGRKDFVHQFGKLLPLPAAAVLTALMSVTAISLPALLLVVSEEQALADADNGSASAMLWASSSALVGNYHVVGLISTSYVYQSVAAAYVLMYVNAVLAVLSSIAVAVAIVHQGRRAAAKRSTLSQGGGELGVVQEPLQVHVLGTKMPSMLRKCQELAGPAADLESRHAPIPGDGDLPHAAKVLM